MGDSEEIDYWLETKETLFSLLDTTANGLTSKEASLREKIYGKNELVQKKKKALLAAFFSKFLNPLILILLGAGLVSFFLGQITEFLIIQLTVVIGVIIDFYQEYQAEDAVEKLQKQVSLTATVLRHGFRQEVDVTELVCGDIIFLVTGDVVPADARLISSSANLLVNQAILTGESYPQEKDANLILPRSTRVVERVNSVFMGTSIVSGEAQALVVATGKRTELGRISRQFMEKRPKTEFERGIEQFGFLLMRVVLILVVFVFLVNAFLRHGLFESFLFAIALAVGITPELLPMIITINLAKGAVSMAKKKVIVKDLQAIQNLGSVEVLCTDKTGTLTEGTIRLAKYEDVEQKQSQQVLILGYLNSFYQRGLKSLLASSLVKQYQGKFPTKAYKLVGEVPFDFNRKRLSVIVSHKNKLFLITKGAPEGIFKLCNHCINKGKKSVFTTLLRRKVIKRFGDLGRQGYRVVAVAFKETAKKKVFEKGDEKNLTFLGLMAFFDPPKKTVTETLPLLEKQGVELKILTGDSEEVTKRICEEIGLSIKKTILGEELDKIGDEKLLTLVKEITIFARLDPEQKKRIITALKTAGLVVGYLGDGINDTLPLKTADVGISVENAVDVAKEAADLILMRKDLHVLKDGIIEGRKTYGNVMKYILMGTSSNFGNMSSMAVASLFVPFLPMLPVQILLNNLLYEISQLAISSDRVDETYLHKPKKWNIGFIRHFMVIFGPISSIFDLLTFVILLFIFRASASFFQTGWFIESLTTQAVIIFSIRTKVIPFYKSRPSLWLILISLGVIVVSWLFPFGPLSEAFGFVKLPLNFYLILVSMVLIYIFLVEQSKKWFYRKYEL